METLIKASQLILSLSLLVLVHEFGHFMFAKLFEARVEKFYLFFDPWFSIFKIKKGDTEYGMGWIPFGGYCKITGMVDESMDTEMLKQPPQPHEFRSKTATQRLLIMVGGVMMNLILAICIYIGLSYTYGTSYIDNKDVKDGYMYSETAHKMGFEDGDVILNIDGNKLGNYLDLVPTILFEEANYVEVSRNGKKKKIAIDKSFIPELLQKGNYMVQLRFPVVVDSVVVDSRAFQGGLKRGDNIIAVNGERTPYFDQFKKALAANAGDTTTLSILRDGTSRELKVIVAADSTIGFIPGMVLDDIYKVTTVKYSLLESIPQGFKLAGDQISNYLKQIKLIFTPETEAYKSVGSVVSMGGMFSPTWDWLRFWNITALLSIVLAVMNILPIPALDGGHVLFLLYEVITRRKPSDKFLEFAQTVGMIFILALMVLALGNDIYKLFQ